MEGTVSPSSRGDAVENDLNHASTSQTFFLKEEGGLSGGPDRIDNYDDDDDVACDAPKCPTTIDEERASVAEADRELELSSAWILTAEREMRIQEQKIERLRITPGTSAEDVESLRIDHELKTREINVARLRHRKLRADLAREAYALAELELANARVLKRTREVQTELERIQLYVAVVKSSPLALNDPNRRHFFYTDCHVGGLGQWFCECLSERPNWHPYPCQKWFVSDANLSKPQQIYCPVGKVMVDFTDQPSFASVCSSCPGSNWLEDKCNLARLIVPLGLMVPTWFIRDQKWVGEEAPSHVPGTWDHIWFLKESDKNFATGIAVKGTPQECFDAAEPGKTYVLQPSVPNPRCDARGHKLGWRLYIACVSPAGSNRLHWYFFCGGYLLAADGPFGKHDLAPLAQITKDRVMEFNSWEGLEESEETMRNAITEMLRVAQPRFAPPTSKACFELFGVDIAMTGEGAVWIIEVNRSPRVKPPDKPMLHALLNLAAPRYGFPQPGAVWDPLDVDPEATDTWYRDEEAEKEELDAWGRTRWGPAGKDLQAPLPGAFGGELEAGWGARREA